jgi:uncharacterized membrane protein YgcG
MNNGHPPVRSTASHVAPIRQRAPRPAFAPALVATMCVLISLSAPRNALAQRELHWRRLQVEARLGADGSLHVVETHTMVFTGDWNGGERRFNIRPQQSLSFTRISRQDGGTWRDLNLNSALEAADQYAWTDSETLRWRSRLPTDPPFANTTITYALEYDLAGVLVTSGEGYQLDHDFAFPDRAGPIYDFALSLDFDSAWQPPTEVPRTYSASGLRPGRGFVLTIPLRYSGAGLPQTRTVRSARGIALAASILLGATALAVLAFMWREDSYGRFAPVPTDAVDAAWIAEHILKYPAEVVGAAWDEDIGTPEVVALVARMVAEGKLESSVSAAGGLSGSMTLRLKVDRSTLTGHERTLVDALFFDGRTETSTADVRDHYSATGFDPAKAIRPRIEARVLMIYGERDTPPLIGVVPLAWFLISVVLLAIAWYRDDADAETARWFCGVALIAAAVARAVGLLFRGRMDWGRRAALICFVPAVAVAAYSVAFFWSGVGPGADDPSALLQAAVVLLSLWVTYSTIRGARSRPSPAALAIRKNLTAAREFFSAQLELAQPALRDEWYPWILAFGLGKQVDAWSATRAPATIDDRTEHRREYESSSVSTSRSSSSESFTGFGGGRSGGAGAEASWSMAAAGLAGAMSATTSASDSSSSGSSSGGWSGGDSSGGGSSGGGSSGGGGGGGW